MVNGGMGEELGESAKGEEEEEDSDRVRYQPEFQIRSGRWDGENNSRVAVGIGGVLHT
jgi:hypothetical protein